MRVKLVIGIAIVVAATLAVRWYTNPVRQITRALGRIEGLVAKAPGEDNLTALGKARALSEMFADPFEFEAEQFDFSTRDRQRLAAAVHQYRSRSQAIGVAIRDRDVSVLPEQNRGTVHLTVEFATKFQDLAGREAYRFQMNWVEQDDEWRIDYVRLLEIVADPPGRPF